MQASLLQLATKGQPYFDAPERARPGQHHFILRGARGRGGVIRFDMPGWTGLHPAGLTLPPQGWKVHVSATIENAQQLLDEVGAYALDRRMSFKWVPSREQLFERNGKQAHRGGSGKFITLYPQSEEELHTVLLELDELVGGQPGPYILSDLRWNSGPLYVRYGAFRRRDLQQEDGALVPAIEAPDGSLVPDLREPSFTPPAWVELPTFLREQLDKLGDGKAPDEFRYDISDALLFTNGGGTYRASDGRRGVIIKEGRPHAGITPDGRDAAQRIRDEEAALRLFSEDPAVVNVHEGLSLDGHRFVVLEEIEGTTLNRAIVQRTPLVRADATPAAFSAYRAWALSIAQQLDDVIARIHGAGRIYGDLHFANVMVTPDDQVVLIDFEMSKPQESSEASVIAAAGFAPPPDLHGCDADLYSLACVKLALFLPLTHLIALDPTKAPDLIETAAATFHLPKQFVNGIARWLAPVRQGTDTASGLSVLARRIRDGWRTSTEDQLAGIETLISRGINESADFTRSDRCYPGDPRQFSENGYGLAHGAAGILSTLEHTGMHTNPMAWEWLVDAIRNAQDGRHLGLYNGLAGVGWLLRHTGRHDAADLVRQRVLDGVDTALGPEPGGGLSAGIYGGLAGIGLYLLDEQAGQFDDALARIADELQTRVTSGLAMSSSESGPGHGLMWGPTGIALFASRLFAHTGEASHLALATQALGIDLDRCIPADDGSLQMDETRRLMPYLATGSAGCALVAAQLLPLVSDREPYLRAIRGIEKALRVPFTIEPGLFHGRAGLVHVLVLLSRLGLASFEAEQALRAHIDGFKLHALQHGIGIGFPGTGLLEKSSDLATGSAGVLSAIHAHLLLTTDNDSDEWPALLPLLLPPRSH